MHNFEISRHRRQPGGYMQANLIIDQFIAQARRNFQQEHQNCRYTSSESDEERCEVCGEFGSFEEPWKSSGGMHNFADLTASRHCPAGTRRPNSLSNDDRPRQGGLHTGSYS